MVNGWNVVLIHGFKDCWAILFFRESMLADPDSLLSQPGRSREDRQPGFTGLDNAEEMVTRIRVFTNEANEPEKAG
ncbi:MAG: hypothetical protein M1148_00670 [Candidatus Thermoplasmatota archaeon]|nr:hypothetical protein [Candidatus Thermoplasmatota archaeon]MCL5437696.1 hypothetical protein [Candidatus Thermoplasmatota archaeon]